MTIFVTAGHPLGGGAAVGPLRESPYNAHVAVLTVWRLREAGLEAWMAPLTRRPYPHDIHFKTAWINARATPPDVAVDVHLDIGRSGCAVFALEGPEHLALADLVAEELARGTGLACRGGMPERETAVGRLGFLHGVVCRALLVELCSMNTDDARFARRPGAKGRFAEALATGLAEIVALGEHRITSPTTGAYRCPSRLDTTPPPCVNRRDGWIGDDEHGHSDGAVGATAAGAAADVGLDRCLGDLQPRV